jgi:8-oxo-dGTP pyrophosphatase MutT (NUDIX family)
VVERIHIAQILPASSALILIRDRTGRVCLQFRDGSAPVDPLSWGLWGGRLEPEDDTPAAAAARELREELGLIASAQHLDLVAEFIDPAGRVAQLLEFTLRVSWADIDVREGAGAAFFNYDELTLLSLPTRLAALVAALPHLFRQNDTL